MNEISFKPMRSTYNDTPIEISKSELISIKYSNSYQNLKNNYNATIYTGVTVQDDNTFKTSRDLYGEKTLGDIDCQNGLVFQDVNTTRNCLGRYLDRYAYLFNILEVSVKRKKYNHINLGDVVKLENEKFLVYQMSYDKDFDIINFTLYGESTVIL